MADYATVEQIEVFAQEPDALSQEGWAILATSASRLFDNLCDVEDNFFNIAASEAGPSSGRTSKVFYGNGTAYLKLAPYIAGSIATVDGVVITDEDDEELTTPEYYEQNGYLVIKGYGAGVATTDRYRHSPWPSDQYRYSEFYPTSFEGWSLNRTITIYARWGFSAIPTDVTQAVIQLAIHLQRTTDPAFTAISQSGEPYAAPAIPVQVAEIVSRYKEKYSSVVFA